MKLTLIHGWGVNSAIWREYIEGYLQNFDCTCIDLPGYGSAADVSCSYDISELAEYCLENAPELSIWIGWSLGGAVALKAAELDAGKGQIQALQIINSSAKFVRSDDWPHGVETPLFRKFANELAADYETTLSRFLMIQTVMDPSARKSALKLANLISSYPEPSLGTLMAGLDCLAKTDLRHLQNVVSVSTQVVSSRLDRVTPPGASKALAQQLSADLVEVNAGHAPFITHPQQVAKALSALVNKASQLS